MIKAEDIKEFREAMNMISETADNIFMVEFLSSVKHHNVDEQLLKRLCNLNTSLHEAVAHVNSIYDYLQGKNNP